MASTPRGLPSPGTEYHLFHLLNSNFLKVQNPNGTYQCPFCPARKKKNYRHSEILQHASGVAASSAKDLATRLSHSALASFLLSSAPTAEAPSAAPSYSPIVPPPPPPRSVPQRGLATSLFSSPSSSVPSSSSFRAGAAKPPVSSVAALIPVASYVSAEKPVSTSAAEAPEVVALEEETQERFVYPWIGILANLPTNVDPDKGKRVGDRGLQAKKKLASFNPQRVRTLWDDFGHTGWAIVEFSSDWRGFGDAMMFERHYNSNGQGKKDWEQRGKDCATTMETYGWVARAYDYDAGGIVCEHLQRNGDLKSLIELKADEDQKMELLINSLVGQIKEKEKHKQELEVKYKLSSLWLERMMNERAKLSNSYSEEVLKKRQISFENFRKIFEDNEKLRTELEQKSKGLDALAAETDINMLSLNSENLKSTITALPDATVERIKANENIARFLEDQRKEIDCAFKKVIQLEKQLIAKQKLESKIEQLKQKLQAMANTGKEDPTLAENISELNEELNEKIEEMEDLESMNETLVAKELLCSNEMVEAREELISVLSQMVNGKASHIGVKRVGEVDIEPFKRACQEKFVTEDYEIKAAEFCSKWEEDIKNSKWNPFKTVIIDGRHQEIIDGNDEKLKELKRDLGYEAHQTVCTALLELNEHNPDARHEVQEIWNFKDGRKATLQEGLRCLLMKWKTARSS